MRPLHDDDLTWLPGWRLRELMIGREVSPREVARHFLDRIERLDPGLHCFVTVSADEAMRSARELERDRASARDRPLYGIPVSVKDQCPTEGVRTTAGSRLYAGYVPAADAAVVARLKAAGAVIVGKTTTPEFALSWHTRSYVAAATVNPWDTRRTAGGSSGGAAASVAAGLSPVAIGSDCAGSIRLPAAFCGVIGLAPTLGRVPAHDCIGGSPHFTRIGPIARDPLDAALVSRVIGDPPGIAADGDGSRGGDPGAVRIPPLPPPELRGLRCGWWTAARTAVTDERVVTAARAAAGTADQLGAHVSEIGGPLLDEQAIEAFGCVNGRDRYLSHGREIMADPARRAQLTPLTASWFETASHYGEAEYALALDRRQHVTAEIELLLEHHDVLLSPTVDFTAPAQPADWFSRPPGITAHTVVASLCGFPAVTLPCGFADGLPVGLQIIGRGHREETLLAVAAALAAALPPPGRPPAPGPATVTGAHHDGRAP